MTADERDRLADARSEAAEAWRHVERLQWAYDLLRVRVESTDQALHAVLTEPAAVAERRHLEVAA